MKLIIDVPENEYRGIKEYYEKNDIVESAYSYIYHGIPLEQEPNVDILDKIRAELLMMECMEDAIEVIDKYKAGGMI